MHTDAQTQTHTDTQTQTHTHTLTHTLTHTHTHTHSHTHTHTHTHTSRYTTRHREALRLLFGTLILVVFGVPVIVQITCCKCCAALSPYNASFLVSMPVHFQRSRDTCLQHSFVMFSGGTTSYDAADIAAAIATHATHATHTHTRTHAHTHAHTHTHTHTHTQQQQQQPWSLTRALLPTKQNTFARACRHAVGVAGQTNYQPDCVLHALR
jgi:hypothetical protein